MKILGVDYGRKKIGLAVSEGRLASPLKVIRVNSFGEAVKKTLSEAKTQVAEKIVVGISESEMEKESRVFAKSIGAAVFDETLSSFDAQNLSIETGMKRKKRKNMEDAFAAAVILQRFIDSTP